VGLMRELGRGPACLDSVGFIYFVEEHPRFLPVIEPLFQAADKGRLEVVTSSLTLLEVLTVPYRSGDLDLIHRYEALLTRSRGLRLVEIDHGQLHSAANLRARHRLKTPDALQISAALHGGCEFFVTNDRDLPDIPGLTILELKDFLSG